ncbi:MAG: DMT family transporter [Flavobacteriales bacterium]|jgi:RarD protein|nr:DMT family transporter [Flavobacteriales bacterium]
MSETLKSWLLLILLSCVWGSSFVLIKMGLFDSAGAVRLPADQLGALRVTFAFLALVPILLRSFKYLSKDNFIFLMIAGVCGNGLPAFLFAYAETTLNSSITGMLNSLVPLFTIIIGAVFFSFKIKKIHLIGIAVAVLGTFLIVQEKLIGVKITTGMLLPFFALILATMCYATSLNVIKYKLVNVKSTAITALSFFMISPFAIGYLISSDFTTRIQTQENILPGVGAILILAIVGTATAVLLFNKLIKISSPIFASSVTYFIPIVAIIIGWIIGESISLLQLLGMGVLIAGVLIINRGK